MISNTLRFVQGQNVARSSFQLLRKVEFSTSEINNRYRVEDEEKEPDRMKLYRIVTYNRRHGDSKDNLKKIFKKFEKPPEVGNVRLHKYGGRSAGIRHAGYWERVPEMVPELIVPDLTDFDLKPYVSYRVKDIYQEELTARDLFNAVYGPKIYKDYKEGKIDDEGQSLEPSENEKMTPEEARIKARQTGSDIYSGGLQRDKRFNVRWTYE